MHWNTEHRNTEHRKHCTLVAVVNSSQRGSEHAFPIQNTDAILVWDIFTPLSPFEIRLFFRLAVTFHFLHVLVLQKNYVGGWFWNLNLYLLHTAVLKMCIRQCIFLKILPAFHIHAPSEVCPVEVYSLDPANEEVFLNRQITSFVYFKAVIIRHIHICTS